MLSKVVRIVKKIASFLQCKQKKNTKQKNKETIEKKRQQLNNNNNVMRSTTYLPRRARELHPPNKFGHHLKIG